MPSAHLFFFNDTATTEIYTLSLHDALPIYVKGLELACSIPADLVAQVKGDPLRLGQVERKSTRLNSSHDQISYAVFCLKKKNGPPPRHARSPSSPRPGASTADVDRRQRRAP